MKTSNLAASKSLRKGAQALTERRADEGLRLAQFSLAPTAEFGEKQKDALSAVTVLDVTTHAITAQSDFKDLDGVENLKAHQAESKLDANTWWKDVRPALFSVNDAIINYNAEFGTLYDPLYQFAGQLGDPAQCADAQSKLVAGLQALQEVMRAQKKRVDDATEKLNNLRSSMLTHEAALEGDQTEINAKYLSDTGKIADLQKEIQAYTDAMQRDLTIIGLGAGGMVVGGLVAAVGVALWIETAGGSTALIYVGVAGAVGSGAAMAYGIYDYNSSSDKKAQAIRDLATINAEIAVAELLKRDVSTLVSHLDNASAALEKLGGAWGQLDRDYQNIIEALHRTEGNAEKTKPLAFIVQANLEASKQQWGILVVDANSVKNNLLSPMKIDTSAVDKSDGKPARPNNAPLPPVKSLTAARTTRLYAVAAPQQLTAETVDTGYRLWVENTAKAVSSFENDLKSLTAKSTAPAQVVKANDNLTAIAAPAIGAANEFLGANEELSREAVALRTAAKLGDDAIVGAAVKIFEEVAAKVVIAKSKGQTASDMISNLESSVNAVDAALSVWLSDMKAEQAFDKGKLDDATRLRASAQRDKDNIKKDYWYCLLGAVACAVVAIEASVRISNAQSEIDSYNSKMSTLNAALADLLTATSYTTSLTAQSVALSKGIDGGLTALQIIKSTVDGINATIHDLTPFIVRARLNAVAEQIEGASTVRLANSARVLFKIMAAVEDRGLVGVLQKLASSSMMIQLSALVSVKQPKLVYVENLLKQDQSLLCGHALEWIVTYSNNVLSEFSSIRAAGDNIQYLGKEVLDFSAKGDIANAAAGIDGIVDSFSTLKERLFNDTLRMTQFDENLKNDRNRFNTVADVLRTQIEGKSGQLATMETKESAYSAAITQSLSDIVNNSTNVICQYLEWGAVLAVSIGLGQIEFAAAEAGSAMFLVKTGAKLALKAASDAGSAQAKAEFKKIERKGGDIDTLVSDRSDNLESMSKLKADMAVLHVLLNDVSTMVANSAAVLNTLGDIKDSLQSEITNFYSIKYALKSSSPSDGVAQLKTALKAWEDIGKASDLLEKTFMASFTS